MWIKLIVFKKKRSQLALREPAIPCALLNNFYTYTMHSAWHKFHQHKYLWSHAKFDHLPSLVLFNCYSLFLYRVYSSFLFVWCSLFGATLCVVSLFFFAHSLSAVHWISLEYVNKKTCFEQLGRRMNWNESKKLYSIKKRGGETTQHKKKNHQNWWIIAGSGTYFLCCVVIVVAFLFGDR